MPVRPRNPLFAIVYAASSSLVVVSLVALVWLAGEQVETTATRSMVSADQMAVRSLTRLAVTVPVGEPPVFDPDRITQADLDALTAQGYLELTILSPDGRVLVGDHPTAGGPVLADDLTRSLAGESRASLLEGGQRADGGPALVEHLPLLVDDRVIAVVRIERDATAILADVEMTRSYIAVIASAGAVALALLLFLIYRAANRRIGLQALRLAEAARHDPLTGLLNHGSIVEHLSGAIEAAGPRDIDVGIALIDIDNFRMLNETHGHAAGDFVLMQLARELEIERGPSSTIGRFGPDEFLVVARNGTARELEPTIEGLRRRLDATALDVGAAEQLPVSISVGIAHFPWHASSATDLLSAATVALGEAKSGGGGGVRTAGEWDDDTKPGHGHFDVYRALVIAVDTKDRYTKRHSEDVARYAVFLARELGLDDALVDIVRTAGLLHDVGKIGVPDDVLRKPGKLTAHEYDIVKQHVVLGDLIVRDLPASWLIRTGIRHHHERWDGTGYVDHLEGEAIPLIARLLAVADAFSAMTTSRPYRKSLDVREALRRIEDGAGTQLDASLATAFVTAMESAPDAPLPGSDRDRLRIWTPSAAA